MEVDITPILQVLQGLFVALLSAGVVLGRKYLLRWLNLREDSEVRAYFDEGAMNIIRAVNAKLGELVDDNGRVYFDDQRMGMAVELVSDHFPDAVERFRLNRQQIEDALASRWNIASQMDRWQEARALPPPDAVPDATS